MIIVNIKLHNITCDAYILDKTSYLNVSPLAITANFKDSPQDELYPVLIIKMSNYTSNYNYVY